jgi:hypothetical protein
VVLCAGCKQGVGTTALTSPLTVTSVGTTTTSVDTSTSTISPPQSAPVSIDENSDGQTIRVNLIKFTGTLPSQDATILVNNNAVTVDSSGNYYIYLNLQKGQNTIEVKTSTAAQTVTKNITIFFNPPLIIRVSFNQTSFDPSTVFKIPLQIKGIVSNPAAEVTVNGSNVKVNCDGAFTSQLPEVAGWNSISARAVLGNEIDEDDWSWGMDNNGITETIPSFVTFPYILPAVTVNAGESVSFNLGLRFDKWIPDASSNSISITRINEMDNGSTNLPNLPGLKVSVDPSRYTTYPNITYNSQVTIALSPSLPPGNYYFNISSSLGIGALFAPGGFALNHNLSQGMPGPPRGDDFEVIVK